jgi:hypothetical protein
MEAFDQYFGRCITLGIKQLVRMTIAAQELLQPKHVAVLGPPDALVFGALPCRRPP